jgi:hypothetical protein
MKTSDTDLRERLAQLRDLEPTDEEIARLLASADELRAPQRRARRPLRALALVAAVAAVLGGVLAALPGCKDAARSQSAHGILQAAAAVAAEQPGPAEDLKAYRYTRVLTRFVDLVQVDGGRNHAIWQQTSENWMERPPTERMRSIDGASAIVKPYDGDFRYGDGPMARVPFAALQTDPGAARQAHGGRDRRHAPGASPEQPSALGPGVVESEVGHSAVTLLALGNLTSAQRSAPFQVLSNRPAPARSATCATRPAARASGSSCRCARAAAGCR